MQNDIPSKDAQLQEKDKALEQNQSELDQLEQLMQLKEIQ